MAKIYYRLIKDKKLSIEDVPALWRAATQALLDADNTAPARVDTPAPENGARDATGIEAGAGGLTNVLHAKTITKLKEYAATNNIDVGGVTRKSDLLTVIEAAEAGKKV